MSQRARRKSSAKRRDRRRSHSTGHFSYIRPTSSSSGSSPFLQHLFDGVQNRGRSPQNNSSPVPPVYDGLTISDRSPQNNSSPVSSFYDGLTISDRRKKAPGQGGNYSKRNRNRNKSRRKSRRY